MTDLTEMDVFVGFVALETEILLTLSFKSQEITKIDATQPRFQNI